MAYATVDPGLNGTGWAVWTEDWELLDHGVLKRVKASQIKDRKALMAKALRLQLQFYEVTQAWIEYPAKFQSAKGEMVANKGDLVKLAELVGYYSASLNAAEIQTKDLEVNIWKGQMTKEAVMHRIKRVLPKVRPESHDWDAIGMGLFLKGRF